MKLIRCRTCGDPVALSLRWRSCHCGESGCAYRTDGDKAILAGPCDLFGVSNRVLYFNERGEAWPYEESNGKIARLAENPRSMRAAERGVAA